MTIDATHRFIEQLSAASNWGIERDLLTTNSFTGMARRIKVPKGKRKSDDDDIDPFTKDERDQIIAAFRSHKNYRGYADLVEFLFFKGARPSEALALEWRHVAKGFKSIRFEQALTDSEDGLRIKQGLKTQERRTFPANDDMVAFLTRIRAKAPERTDPTSLVFKAPRATFINWRNFLDRGWKKVLETLNLRFRNPYQMRHTFITLVLAAGVSYSDVGKLCGNSPETILKHYAGVSRDLKVPKL